ncbi:Gfo/Idh/MocA family oxidoreductase [Kribbella sp. NPDC056861]|uniref:Gfo/Idh/MocA family protein n=1 Tax=Kribbella sp. NPDC056861 TaxID=3154857 RepID=UPI003441230E
MSERVRVAVVGAGGWGRQHARAFSQHSKAELVGVWSRDLGRAEARATDWHTKGFDDLDRMLDETTPDLVSVCLPNTEHFLLTRQLIARGIPLLVEKPLVFDLAEGETLIREAAERDLFFAINFNHRYAVPVLRARDDLAAGRLGELEFLTWRFGGEGGSDHHPHANLIETQCHGIDLLEHLGGPIESVTADMTDAQGNHPTVVATLRFAGGAVGSLLGSYNSSYAYPGTHLLEVNGHRGRLLIEDTVKRYTFSTAGEPTREVWEASYFDDRSRSFEQTFDTHLDALLPALQSGAPPPVPARAGLRALTVATAIIQAHQTGRRTQVPSG